MRYRIIDVRIWFDPKFLNLSPMQPCGRGLFVYLLTNPHTNSIPGLYRAGKAAIAEELNWPIEGLGEAFDEVINQGLVKADFQARVIFIPNAIKYNKPQSPNVIKSWASHWDEIPECDLKNSAYETLRDFIKTMGEPFLKAFDEAIAKASGKVMFNQEQDQEHKQELNLNNLEINNDAEEVFNYWRITTNHIRAKFDAKRVRIINAAFKLGFTVDELKQAIDGCVKSSWHMGRNEHKRKYDDIGLILRDAAHVEQFIGIVSTENTTDNVNSIVSHIDQMYEGAI